MGVKSAQGLARYRVAPNRQNMLSQNCAGNLVSNVQAQSTFRLLDRIVRHYRIRLGLLLGQRFVFFRRFLGLLFVRRVPLCLIRALGFWSRLRLCLALGFGRAPVM